MSGKREKWGSGFGFILAASGSAIGLGNIWKFPYIAGENGGAAFLLVYLLAILIVGVPVLFAEILIGRKSQLNPVGAFAALSNNKTLWKAVGYMGILTSFIILSYYNVVAGWSLGYVIEGFKGSFSEFTNAEIAGNYFKDHISNTSWIISWQSVFAIITITVVYFGVNKGIEKIAKILMPMFFVILLFLVFWGISLPDSSKGLAFLFSPDWSSLTSASILIALGHAFFTLSLGMGALLTYGSYLDTKENIVMSGIAIAFLDTLIAILAGIAIFTAVFSMGFEPDAGPGLAFQVLPAVFARMPGGDIFAVLFFGLLVIAALTSSISLLEVATSYLVDEKGFDRKKVVLYVGFIVFLFGVPSALSFGVWSEFTLFGMNFFDLMDYFSANILLPLGGMFIAIFIGWSIGKEKAVMWLREGAEKYSDTFMSVWFVFVKYISPAAIALVILKQLGII